MLTGELPLGRFAAPSQVAAVDGRLDEVVFRALEREPERRYQHASEIKGELESIAGTAPREGGADGALPQAAPYAVERVQLLVKGPAVMLLLSALAGLLFWAGMGVAGIIYYCTDRLVRADIIPPFAILILGGGTVAVLALTGTLFAGARKLLRFEGYELIIVALTLAILPWSPHVVLGIPATLWCFWILSRPEVTAAFAANLRRRQRRTGASLLTPAGGEPARPAGPIRGKVRSFLRALRSVFVGTRS